jgi:transcriptional regulator with XRE-family HTH domain/tetratricopeptide (TPR) repeat protein
METTFSFGYWVQRRRKALNLTQAALARQVGCATITIKKIERDERRPSRLMAERLADSLMLAPPERASFVGGALGELPIDALPIAAEPLPAAPRPALSGPPPEERHPFVSREHELSWLQAQLELALAGEGRMAVIAGEAGRGKTALMAAFIQHAAHSRPALLVASGACNAYAGTGDPYLPFREILGSLTGDTESRWMAAGHATENTRRLWQALPTTLPLLVQHAPQLIDVLVPAKGLLARARAASPGGAAWLTQLEAEVARRLGGAVAPDQSALFVQITSLLGRLAEHYPLLLNLDDLHWADEASLGLLFHLVRRLAGSRVLVVGAYRPEELAGPPDRRHPLEGVLDEIKRTYGASCLDLEAADRRSGRTFVSAFLDTEPNRFDADFREALFHQTGGHALFTVELLHEMQARRDLVLDAEGQWCPGQALDWSTLPARVEAVIARRLDRLEPVLRDMLTVASVEGEKFTAEVVAHVLGTDEALLVRTLSQQLGRRYRLVRASGEVAADDRYLSPYQFDHALFQQYLYQQLDPGERLRLHASIAAALETLYGSQTDLIAVQLARHYEAAHLPHQAVEYLRRAGEKAIRLSAPFEAVTLLRQALDLLANLHPVQPQQTLRLQLALGEAQHMAGRLVEALATFEAAATLAHQLNEPEAEAHAALGYEESRWRFNLPADRSAALLRQALAGLGPGQPVLHARLRVSLAQALMPVSSPKQFAARSQQALALARSVGDPRTLFEALYLVMRSDRRPERAAERLAALDEMLRLVPAAGLGRAAIVDARGFMALEYLEQGNLEAYRATQAIWSALVQELQLPFYIYSPLLSRTMQALIAGRLVEAEQLARQALRVGQSLQVEQVDGVFGVQMFSIRREQGRLGELAPLVRQIASQNPDHAVWRPGLALIYAELGLRADALQEFERLAADNFSLVPRDDLWATCMLYLAEVCAFLGDAPRAALLYQHLRPYAGRTIVVGFNAAFLGAADHYLGLLCATQGRWSEAEQHYLEALSLSSRLEAWPWVAHTQFEYAALLLKRGRPPDQGYAQQLLDQALETAGRLGMQALAHKAAALRAW